MRPVSYFIDSFGLLDKMAGRDGGDTCQREGMFWSLLKMMKTNDTTKYTRTKENEISLSEEHYLKVMERLHVAPGVFVRHPNPKWDTSDWDRMSRDQLQPMIIAAGFWSRKELNKIARGHLGRGFLFANNTRKNGANKFTHGKDIGGEVRDYNWKFPDPTAFDIWGNFIRAYNSWLLYPLLFLFDLELLGGSIIWRFFPKHNITMNHTLSLMQARHRMPTPISWLSEKIMSFDRLIKLLGQHFRDFGDDMEFFEQMFKDAK